MSGYLVAALAMGYCFALFAALAKSFDDNYVVGATWGVIGFLMTLLPLAYFFNTFIFN